MESDINISAHSDRDHFDMFLFQLSPVGAVEVVLSVTQNISGWANDYLAEMNIVILPDIDR